MFNCFKLRPSLESAVYKVEMKFGWDTVDTHYNGRWAEKVLMELEDFGKNIHEL